MSNTDPHYSLQVPGSVGSSKGGARPVSVQPASSSSQSQSSRKRASHTVVSSSQHHVSDDNLPVYRDVYSHPAAVSYAAAHPRRTIPKFGPYLLLQTLGEGEFGKVKLGLHMQWGEEVAVKLIRRGNIDSSARMSKVEREIEVLRTLKHPNIVRLYDVIETDKYIGIILEYASGGELFDHILAHRYLKEKDACKLFCQLISGVWYIHQKKIVHRDLKLENLLLDRHRNVIITDFGFANRFEHKSDELMQTSCGSPCYAAPELVISDGMYVGSAVDVWSCGVILYAMLAGYLPFDDDPANPDGDNINLLYKYIVNTPLSFPDYISSEARDLLSLMLVPDPRHRADLTQVMDHLWLQPYAHLFSRSVGELEHAAMEQHQAKRLAYQRQMKATAAAEAQQKMSRSQSARTEGVLNSSNIVPSSRSRSHRDYSQPQQQEYLYETSVDQSIYSPPAPVAASTNSRRVINSQIVLPSNSNLMVDDDPFAPTPSKEKFASEVIASPIDEVSRESDARGEPKAKIEGIQGKMKDPETVNGPVVAPVKMSPDAKKPKGGFRHTIQVEYGEDDERKQKPKSTSHAIPVFTTTDTEVRANGTGRPPISTSAREKTPRRPSVDTQTGSSKALPPTPATSDSTARRRTGSKSSTSPPSVAQEPQPAVVFTEVTSSPTPTTANTDKIASPGSTFNGTQSKHKKGLSMDKIGLGKIFGVGIEQQPPQVNGATTNGSLRMPSDSDANSSSGSAKRPSTLQVPPPQSTTISGASTKTPSLLSPVTSSSASTTSSKGRRNTLTVMVEPFSRPLRQKAKGKTDATLEAQKEKVAPSEPIVVPPKSVISPLPAAKFAGSSRTSFGIGLGNAASTSKARKVMEWFRTKSKGKVPTEDVPVASDKELPSADATAGSSSTTVDNGAPAVQVFSPTSVSEETTPKSITLPITGHPQRTPSVATDRSFTNLVKRTVIPSPGPKNVLRVHHGAVDQTTITSGSPPDVMKHVLKVLESMGLEVQEESQYKYRCVRPKKRKIGSTGLGLNLRDVTGSTHGLAAFTMVGSAASGGVDKRGLPMPSHPSGGGMLKGLLMRRQSSQVSNSASSASPPLPSVDVEGLDGPDSPLVVNGEPSSPTGQTTIYGDQTQDQGGEVRFSVELTRLDRLEDMYSLDIRRLKGNLKSYKFLYDSLRDRANLQKR